MAISGGSAWDSPPEETAMTQNKNRKQVIRDRMQADQVPYTEAARRIDAEKAGPAPIVHAFPGADDDVVCGHLERRAGEYVSTDWDEVTCEDCHQARMERERLADELAEAHAEFARQFAADTGTREEPEQAYSRVRGEARQLALMDYDYAARMAGQLADVRRRYLADREHDSEEALTSYRYSYVAVSSGTAREPGRDVQGDPFGGHEFEYESTTDLFRCTECRQYEIAARKYAPDDLPITPCPGWRVEGDPYRAYLLVTDNPEVPEGGYGAAMANKIEATGLGRTARYSWRAGRLLVQSAPSVADDLAHRIRSIRFDVDGRKLPAVSSVERISVEAAQDILTENYAAYVAEYGEPRWVTARSED
jgi:hypothetical protein